MDLKGLLAEVRSLSKAQQAGVAAIMGALVADAAVQPIHWIYDKQAMEIAVSGCHGTPEFLPVSANPYYCLPTGSQSPYGDLLMVMLESLVECKDFNARDNAERMFRLFGPNSLYDRSEPSLYKKNMVDKSMFPFEGKWRNALLRRFVECHSSEVGSVEASIKEDFNVDPDNIIRNIPLVVFLAGKKDFLEILQQSTLQLLSNDMMMALVMAISRVIERYILNASGLSADGLKDDVHPIEQVIQDLRCPGRSCADSLDTAMISLFNEVLRSRGLSLEEASGKFGIS